MRKTEIIWPGHVQTGRTLRVVTKRARLAFPANIRLTPSTRSVTNVAICQGNDLSSTRTADRVSANRCGHLHIRRRRGRREDGRTDPGTAAPRRAGSRTLPRYSSAAPHPRSPTPAGYGTRAKISIRGSAAPRTCGRKNGAGHAGARSSFRIFSSPRRSMTGRALRSR